MNASEKLLRVFILLAAIVIAIGITSAEVFSVGGEAFQPGSDVSYSNTYGMGGAYMNSGSGGLVAPVHLPQGARITGFKVFFNDNSNTSDMLVVLDRLNLNHGAYTWLASVDSKGIFGYGSNSTNNIYQPIVDNTGGGYSVYAWSTSWNTNLKIMGAVIIYDLPPYTITLGEVSPSRAAKSLAANVTLVASPAIEFKQLSADQLNATFGQVVEAKNESI